MHFKITSSSAPESDSHDLQENGGFQDVLVPVARANTNVHRPEVRTESLSVQLDSNSYSSQTSSIHSIQAYLESPLDPWRQPPADLHNTQNPSGQNYPKGVDHELNATGPNGEVAAFSRPHRSAEGTELKQYDFWDSEHEVIAYQWKSVCDKKAVQHMETAIVMKFLYHLMSFPIYTVPLIASQVQRFQDSKQEWQVPLQYLLTFNAVLAGLNTAANLGKRSEQHFNLESQFSRLGKVIGVELEKPRQARQRPKPFLVTSAYQMETLFAISPNLACAKVARCLMAFVRCFRRCCSRNKSCLLHKRAD